MSKLCEVNKLFKLSNRQLLIFFNQNKEWFAGSAATSTSVWYNDDNECVIVPERGAFFGQEFSTSLSFRAFNRQLTSFTLKSEKFERTMYIPLYNDNTPSRLAKKVVLEWVKHLILRAKDKDELIIKLRTFNPCK